MAHIPPALPLAPDIAAQNKAPMMMGVMYSFSALATITVAGRIFSRFRRLGRLTVDDYVIIVSLGFVFAYVGLWTTAILSGGGRHAATLSILDQERSMFLIMMGLVPGVLSLVLPKFAVVSLLIQILFPGPLHVKVLWGLASANLVLMLAAFGFHFSECDPPEARWTVHANAHCRSATVTIVYSVVVGVYSAIVDFYLAVYPAIVLWSTRMHLKKKLALSLALGFGACAGCAALYKCTVVPTMGDHTDYTYDAGSLIIWISVETNSVIIAACIPMLLPLLEVFFGKNFLTAPAPVSLSIRNMSIAGVGSSGNGINNPTQSEKQRTSDELELRMGSILLLEDTTHDEEDSKTWRKNSSGVETMRQRTQRLPL